MTAPDPQVFELDVPMDGGKPPLSANQRLHWAAKASRVAMVRDVVGWRAKQAGIGRQEHVTVQLHWQPQDHRRRDPDNLMATHKPCLDALVDAKIILDDTARYVTSLMPVIHEPDGGGKRLWLRVEVSGGE